MYKKKFNFLYLSIFLSFPFVHHESGINMKPGKELVFNLIPKRLDRSNYKPGLIFTVHCLFTAFQRHCPPVNLHCKENPIYVFLFWELHVLSPNFHIHVSVSDLYIPRISPHISLQQNRQTDPGNI